MLTGTLCIEIVAECRGNNDKFCFCNLMITRCDLITDKTMKSCCCTKVLSALMSRESMLFQLKKIVQKDHVHIRPIFFQILQI